MRRPLLWVAIVLLATTTAALAAPDQNKEKFLSERGPHMDLVRDDAPARAPIAAVRTDTFNFGSYDLATGYAVLGGRWTFDAGTPDPLEGWTSQDQTIGIQDYFRHITSTSWAGHGNTVAAPLIAGSGSVWVGAFENEADALCWTSGLGYGNYWCQRLTSPTLSYSGSGGITLRLKYFQDSEENFDYTRIFLAKGATLLQLNESGAGANDGFSNKINITCTPTGCVLNIPPTPWQKVVSATQMGTAGSYTIRFQFQTDTGWSDQDGQYSTTLGPFGADDVSISGGSTASYNFEGGLQGWTPSRCPSVGSYFAVHPIGIYSIPDPCGCELTGNVLSFHDATYLHPDGQLELAKSNIVDRRAFINYNQIFADWNQFDDLPQANAVMYRPGWEYYPYVCPASGETTWSGRQGQGVWYWGANNTCYLTRNIATNWGIPPDVEYVRFVYEVAAGCDLLGIPPTQCTGVTNFSPIIDNIRVRMCGAANAPAIAYDAGTRFQDGFPMGQDPETNARGNADTVLDIYMDDTNNPDRLGDSLMVYGAPPTPQGAGRWEARLYFRVAREGPAQRSIPRYQTWYYKVKDNLASITGPSAPFTSGWMDSVEAALVMKNAFCSQFRESDDDFVAPEQGEENEIIWDDIFTPGTKVEYFTTSNYICTPNEQFCLPDTTGKFYYEFEILPSFRMVGSVAKFPCLLYVDAHNSGSQFYIENALNVVLHGAGPGAPIPDPANWDRYDYLDATANWCAPLFRGGPGQSTAGATLPQLLGYKTILVGLGDDPAASMDPRDWTGFQQWLQFVDCSANGTLQGLILNGDDVGAILQQDGGLFMNDVMGTTFTCPDYWDPACPPGDPDNDQNLCVRLEGAPGGPWAPAIPTDVFANWCPTRLGYDVLGTNGGVGNKVYRKVNTTTSTQYAQITNDQRSPGNPNNYRSVVDGFSYHHMAKRDLAHPGAATECPNDSASIVEATYGEIRNAIKWTFNIANPLNIGLCLDPCFDPNSDVSDPIANGHFNTLYQNNPNPFNPRTTIKFSLAAEGPAKLVIYDVNGRRVNTLVQGPQAAGPHEAVWDGTDDSGHPVGSGVYWSQLTAGDYSSNKKMVILK